MFKNLRTSTKLLLLCGMFVGTIILATYSLIEEKQIAIEFVRKEPLAHNIWRLCAEFTRSF